MTVTQVQLRVLGLVEVRLGDRVLTVAQPKQRALLALLALRRDTVVSVPEIIDALWDDDPPRNVRNQIQVYVCGLRRLLRVADAAPDVLTTRAAGYLLNPGVGRVDVADFDRAVDAARQLRAAGEPFAAECRLRDALDLWRGPALGDVTGRYFARAAARLEQRRLAVLEQWMQLQLALRRDADLALCLPEVIAQHALHEGLRYGLMLALYRCGRPAQALAVYAEGRQHMIDELGIEPGPALRSLQRAILRGEPASEGHAADGQPEPATSGRGPRPARAAAGGRFRLRRVDVRRPILAGECRSGS